MLCAVLVVASLTSAIPLTPATDAVAFPYDTGSWKKSLEEKTAELEQMILDRHNIDGLVASQVTVIDGKANLTTSGHADVSHSINWTTHYFVGQVYRWKLTQDPAAFERVKEVFEGIYRCQEINGVPGLISRGYVYGHGPTYEERRGHGRGQERWWQGEGKFSNYRWRGNPSHHNHSGFFRAMGIAWALLDDPDIRAKARQNCLEVGRRVFLDNDMAVPDIDGMVTAHLMAWAPKDRPSKRAFMVTSELKVLAVVTEDPEFIALYDKWVDQLRYREFAHRPPEDLLKYVRKGYDDDDHCFAHLDTLRLLEKDEELLAFYRNFTEALWMHHQNDKQALYNITYQAVTGNDGKIEDALWWLRHYPTNKYFQPRMNSIRPDIDELPKPLPLSERPFDNEFDFKGDPYKLDGWQSRIVTDVKAAAIDPMVVYACDNGGYVYRSFNGGASWSDCFQGLAGAKVAAVLPSPEELELVVAATDQGLFESRNAGRTWTKLLEHPASRLMTDPEDPLIAYAVTTAGIYESVAFDSEHWGLTWRSSGGYGPPLPVVHYHVLGDSDGALFIAQDERNTLWTSRPGCDAWRNLSRPFGGRYDFARIAGAGNTLAAFAPGASTIAVSTDGGVNWTPKGRQIYWYGRNAGLAAVDVNDVAVDPRDPNTLYVAGPRNVWVSRDLGDSWQPSNEGLAIPAVSALAADPATGAVYAGTPGGLYESRDAGATWRPSNLVPMFEGLNLIETSPVDYLESYWMARCHGFITVEQAKASWEEEAPRKEE